jgi:hypothetical protein
MITDVHLPTTPYTSVEKLLGWSVLVDVVLGASHPCAVTNHDFAMKAGLLLQKFSNNGKPIKEAMEIILGTLFVAQQEFFHWLSLAKAATTVSTRPPLPACGDIIKELRMGTYNIGKMPDTWAHFATPPKEAKTSLPPSKLKATTGGDNLKPDLVMQKWHKDSGSPALGAMMGPLVDKVPKAGTTRCTCPGCRKASAAQVPHKSNHRELGAEATSRLHDFLDLCKVSAPRP